MSDQNDIGRTDDKLVQALVASSRAERPAEGARGRALDVAVRELGMGADTFARAASPRRARRAALVGVALALGLLAGGLFVQHQQEMQTRAARADLERRAAELEEQAEMSIERVRRELNATKDPEKIAILQAQLADVQQKAYVAKTAPRGVGGGRGASSAPAGAPHNGALATKPCNCTPGDPLCSCL
jgi:uncharacterized protein HemX